MSDPSQTDPAAFWLALDTLVRTHPIIIDRPKGSTHPRYPDYQYAYDYGYLEGTTAADGGGIDVWRGSQPSQQVTGAICTVDAIKSDAEIKILIGCTPAEAQAILAAHQQGAQVGLLILRP